jgi:hypothetical protein
MARQFGWNALRHSRVQACEHHAWEGTSLLHTTDWGPAPITTLKLSKLMATQGTLSEGLIDSWGPLEAYKISAPMDGGLFFSIL